MFGFVADVLYICSMKQVVRHRRLNAFYKSKVLNALIVVVTVCIMIAAYSQTLFLPVICGSLAMLFFVGYSLWLWIKKPKTIVINQWLSSVCSCFVCYYLITTLFDGLNGWWYMIPIVLSVIVLMTTFLNYKDEKYDIIENSAHKS